MTSPPLIQRLTIRTPSDFNFRRTALSHGWYDLPPFRYDKGSGTLERIQMLRDSHIVHCSLSGEDGSVSATVKSWRRLTNSDRKEIAAQTRAILRLDEDFSEFHREARRHPRFRWIAHSGAGRLLRAPTVFEDVVKMICTTNCSWSLTTLMVKNLVEYLGERVDGSSGTFPTAPAVADTREAFLRKRIRLGYRAPFVLELAQRVASGELDVESWRHSTAPTDEVYHQVVSVKGIGPYAAGNILKLLGRYEHLGLDSWVRKRFADMHHNGRRVTDRTIERQYRPFGKWRGLFFWLEMTKHWHDGVPEL
jgi:3-methyladenine DNA glycosylase/8-oxoguanine DNA glycosylase